MQLASVRAVVTGGVSGLGFAVAKHLVAHGGKVALFDVNDEKGAAAVAELGEANARFFKADVSNEAQVAANVADAKAFLGGLNAAINCAGILGAGRVLGKTGPMALSHFQTTVMVNLVGSFNVAKACADLMQHNDAGTDGERSLPTSVICRVGGQHQDSTPPWQGRGGKSRRDVAADQDGARVAPGRAGGVAVALDLALLTGERAQPRHSGDQIGIGSDEEYARHA